MRAEYLRAAPYWMLFVAAACVARSSQPSGAAEFPARPAASAAAIDTEDERYYRRALTLRDRILDRGTWMESDSYACDPGTLRLFSTDSVSAARDSVARDVNALERIIIARGIDNSLDTPHAHDLLRTIIAWEADAERPAWDVKQGRPAPKAIAAGLSGKFLNPETKKCEGLAPFDTVRVVLPMLANFSPPRLANVTFVLAHGEEGLNRMRDSFFVKTLTSPRAVLNYVRVRSAVVWRDFAVIAVNRPVEARGAVPLPKGAGGAAYIFRHVDREWRLLTITRTWG